MDSFCSRYVFYYLQDPSFLTLLVSLSVMAPSLVTKPLISQFIVPLGLSGVGATCRSEQILCGWNLGYGREQEAEVEENQDAISYFFRKSGTASCYQIFWLKSTCSDANGEILRFHM